MTAISKAVISAAIFGIILMAGCDLEYHSNVDVGGKSYKIFAVDEVQVYDGNPPRPPDLYISPGKGYEMLKCSSNSAAGCKKTLETALSHMPAKQTPAVQDDVEDDKMGGGDGGGHG